MIAVWAWLFHSITASAGSVADSAVTPPARCAFATGAAIAPTIAARLRTNRVRCLMPLPFRTRPHGTGLTHNFAALISGLLRVVASDLPTSRGSGACFDGQQPPTRRYILGTN